MSPTDFGERRLELDYPCAWTYTLIGRSEAVLRAAVHELLGSGEPGAPGVRHALAPSNESPGGQWVSLSLDLTVTSEAQRLAIFGALSDHEDVRFVI